MYQTVLLLQVYSIDISILLWILGGHLLQATSTMSPLAVVGLSHGRRLERGEERSWRFYSMADLELSAAWFINRKILLQCSCPSAVHPSNCILILAFKSSSDICSTTPFYLPITLTSHFEISLDSILFIYPFSVYHPFSEILRPFFPQKISVCQIPLRGGHWNSLGL